MFCRSILTVTMVLGLGSLGCTGETGPAGADGLNGADGTNGTNGTDGTDGLDGTNGTDGTDGTDGQDTTVAPVDETGLNLTLDDVTSTASRAGYDVVLTFTITEDGVPYIDSDGVPDETNGLPNLDQATFYAVEYDATTGTFDNSFSFDRKTVTLVDGNSGQYTITATGKSYAPEDSDAEVYAYIAVGDLGAEQPAGGHVHLYDYLSSAALAFGTVESDPYESAANVSGCEKCHGSPYRKHGCREAQVEGLSDFSACKACHYDTRSGGHEDWQILVDDPLRYSEIYNGDSLTSEEEDYYAYNATVMNDVHMSHAMEFPYPQRMSNCVTCHEGKLDVIFADENFTAETCRSCHPVTGDDNYDTADHSLTTIWENAGVASLHSITADCTSCHVAGGVGEAVTLTTLHNGGYDPMIYTSDGTRYSDAIVASIEDASFDSNTYELTVSVKIDEVTDVADFDVTDVEPDVRAALYTYDAKDFFGYESGDTTDNGSGDWTATIDLSDYADDISADGMLRRVEIIVRPALVVAVGALDEDDGSCTDSCSHGYYCDTGECVAEDDITLALNAPSMTFDLAADDFDDGYYEDIVDVEKCNDCHDALATSFHSGDRGGNIVACRMCHLPTNGGSHLEMQSRSLDSYVHAIHSFQAFDPGDIDFTDPVEAMRYDMHIEHRFPNFTIKNCEACHNEGMFEVPDQTLTTPGVLSGSDDVADRDITGVESKVVGPAARACGGCHRAHYINEDDFSGLVSWNQHVALNGYSVDNASGVWDSVLSTIMYDFGEDTQVDADVAPENCAVCHKDVGEEVHQALYDAYIDPN